MMDKIEIWACRWLIKRIKGGYGADCEHLDYEEDALMIPHELNAQGRCGSCRAKEVVQWLEEHIELLEM